MSPRNQRLRTQSPTRTTATTPAAASPTSSSRPRPLVAGRDGRREEPWGRETVVALLTCRPGGLPLAGASAGPRGAVSGGKLMSPNSSEIERHQLKVEIERLAGNQVIEPDRVQVILGIDQVRLGIEVLGGEGGGVGGVTQRGPGARRGG